MRLALTGGLPDVFRPHGASTRSAVRNVASALRTQGQRDVRLLRQGTGVGRPHAAARDRQDRPPGRRRRHGAPTATPSCCAPRSAPSQSSRGRTSSRSPSTTRRRHSPPARSPAASSSARAGRPRSEVLTRRLIDRPIRPLFPKGFRNEVQVVATVLSHDLENDPDDRRDDRLLGRADALRHPVLRPDRRRRVGYANGEYVLNPTLAETRRASSTSCSPARTRAC